MTRASRFLLILLSSLTMPTAIGAEVVWQLEPQLPVEVTDPLGVFPAPLVLDDGTAEGAFGIGGADAESFLWFNQFSLSPSFLDLREIQVLFPSGSNMAMGNVIDLLVFHDTDGDPTNGATWLATYPQAIQSVDGTTFSVYEVNPPLNLPSGGDLLIGVVPRFIVTGTTSQTSPAALDTTTSQGHSWVAVWTGDPPMPPNLPPDLLIDRIDLFVAGNWMIRAATTTTPAHVIPALGPAGLAGLVLLLAAAGLLLCRRRASS